MSEKNADRYKVFVGKWIEVEKSAYDAMYKLHPDQTKLIPAGWEDMDEESPTNHSPAQGEGEANEAALRQFPNGIGQDGIFDMLQEARRLGFIYGANWQKSTYDLMRSIINKMLNIDKPTYTEAELVIIKQSIEAG